MFNSAQIIGFLLVSGNFRTGDSENYFSGETGKEKVNHSQGDTASKNSVSDFGEDQEYFPYGETWVHNKATSEQESTPYKFTSKELDEETGLYAIVHRYYDPKLSGWTSADPAISQGRYFPVPPINDKAKEKNSKLPGMGGVFNSINIDSYQYAGQNPVKFIDPDGNFYIPGSAGFAIGAVWGAVTGVVSGGIQAYRDGGSMRDSANLIVAKASGGATGGAISGAGVELAVEITFFSGTTATAAGVVVASGSGALGEVANVAVTNLFLNQNNTKYEGNYGANIAESAAFNVLGFGIAKHVKNLANVSKNIQSKSINSTWNGVSQVKKIDKLRAKQDVLNQAVSVEEFSKAIY